MPCCEARGYLRTSKHKIKHFVHNKKDGCNYSSETWQHLLCKTEIARACKAMGYDVKTEASGLDWRADVLATKQVKNQLVQLAFEVQWSPQSLEETEQRQQKYIRDEIRCCWLFKKLPTSEARQDIPMFQLQFDASKNPTVISDNNFYILKNFIAEILSGHFKFSQFYRYKKQQDIKIRFFPVNCWKCRQKHYIYHVHNQSYETVCGCNFNLTDYIILTDKVINEPQFLPEIVSKADECLKTEKAKRQNMKMGKIKSRYSTTAGNSYTSFGCPDCDAIFGNHFYFQEICNIESEDIQHIDFETTVNISLEKQDTPHWCYSGNRIFCCKC
ncbi:MAG: competence protein CoiA family protein [Microcoleaceae cyanobacterium]